MTNLRNAAQQVLEKLEQLNSSLRLLDCYRAFDAEITALNAALEQPEQDVPEADCGNICDRCGKVTRDGDVHTCTARRLTDEVHMLQEQNTALDKKLSELSERRLTDEVIADLWARNGTYHHHFARAIERWLRGEE